MKHKIFLIIGRTSSGKTSLAKEICNRLNLKILKSYTTRLPRKNETLENSDHIFITPAEITKYKDKMVAHTIINEIEYFATIDQLLKSDIYIIDPNGIDYLRTNKTIQKSIGDQIEFIEIYIRVPKSTGKRLAVQRGEDIDTYMQRYKNESPQFDYYEKHQQFKYHVLNNGTFEEVVAKLENIIKKELNHDTR